MIPDRRTLCFLALILTLDSLTAIDRSELYPYGMFYGDVILQEGDDETSNVLFLTKPMNFYEASFDNLYVATNGIISTSDLPMEKQYVDDGLPTDFPVIAPFLADIDTSNGKGSIYYRQTESPMVLERVEADVKKGFPDSMFTPSHAFIATWENVSAYEEVSRSSGLSDRVNTFQAVIAYNERDTYALFLYPEDGLQFFGTRPKESYNVEIELPARVGFCRGEVSYLFFSRQEGPHYSVTSNEQSIKNLYQKGNTGTPGVWLFHIGNRDSFQNIVLPPDVAVGHILTTTSPFMTVQLPDEEYSDTDEDEYHIDPDFHDSTTTEFIEPDRDSSVLEGLNRKTSLDSFPLQPSVSGPGDVPQLEPRSDDVTQPQRPLPKHAILQVYPNRLKDVPPHTSGGQVFSVEEKIDFDSGVIQYSPDNRETCERFQTQCSRNAHCMDYPTGFCCHCNSGFYGNGRHCLPSGAPHRVNGKVRGTLLVGGTPVQLDTIDLHAYIVVGDGRAYTAISEVPEPLGWALMPVAPIGGLFGWLFALELPNSLNGFSITGAEFTRRADVTFYPGNQRLSIIQTATGLDTQNYLSVDTQLEGSLPFIPPGSTMQMEPFKDTYQYYPSLITSTSVREFTVVSAEKGSETFTLQVKQNITYRDCSHGPRSRLETQELRIERIFVMFVKEERILRYAITNKIGSVGEGDPEQENLNPCYTGNHDCDTTAQCVPGEEQLFTCQCATGYRGDGHNCYDVDECAEGLSLCGAHSQCVNLPGSHRCQCENGFEFGTDGRTCQDVDECRDQLCHSQALCSNTPGSFYCQCQPGFHGDGFQCHPENGGRPKTQCEHHRDSTQGGEDGLPLLGAFIPQCDEDGQYRPLQCHGSTGHCWCVDSVGREKAGTRTPPGSPPRNCDEPEHPVRPKTQCEHHRDSVRSEVDGLTLVGAFIPQCDEEGQYRPQQCHGSTGHCWCVDSTGQERPGTRTPPESPPRNCDEPVPPKTQCEHHRDSSQGEADGLPLLGAFIPQCDEEGQYRPQQCHESTGHCWCVDSTGQERPGTRTPPGSPRVNCDEPVRPKTRCEHHRDSSQGEADGLPLLGAFIPQCDDEGQYRPQQCHGSTGHCWCVDSTGQERPGTRTPPGSQPKNCDEPVRPKTRCEHHRDSVKSEVDGLTLVGAFIPQCDDEGQYRPQQCHGSTGHCWCVDSTGQERAGTRTPPGSPPKNCDEPVRPKTRCEHHRDSVKSEVDGLTLVGAFIPQCDEEGQYRPQQCHGSTGHCWCVDSTGQERPGTRTPPGSPPRNCDEPVRPKTQCEHHRDSSQGEADGLPLLGAFIPQCDDEGQYRPQQCHGSTGHCWCVDSTGQERPGTRTPPGSPPKNCDEPVRPKTRCEHHRDSVMSEVDGLTLVGAFIPQCDDEGQYRPQQCHGSTGHCWCVDSTGQERPGTRTPPGSPRRNCDEPVRPKTRCEHHRDSSQGETDGLPLLGAFIPQCDDEGQYRPQQCHESTGHCWCVDSTGQERAGTRTPPGSPRRNCDEPVRPKTRCEHHRDSSQGEADGLPLLGAFIPQCDDEGQYRPQQCHGSTGHCWCVDSTGQERAGTRTPPGSPRRNCDQPIIVPPTQRPETVCERWRASLVEHYGGQPESHHYLPQCDTAGEFNPVQCYGDSSYCWCVDRDGREVPGTRSHDAVKPACIPTVAPPTMRPLPRPDVTPPPTGTSLLYAQGQQIGVLPLNGTQMDKQRSSVLLALHGSIVVGIDYDCRERKVYWTDLAGRTINRAGLEPGSEPEIIINAGLMSPEGLAVDVRRRKLFWVDSTPDKIETANLDGTDRQVLFDTDLVNPRAIIVDSSTGTLFWTDWNREAPKIESSSVDGQNRRVLVRDGIGLPNALTYDSSTRQVCWADAGTKRVECISPNGTGRRVIHSNLNYPFSMVSYANHYYFTDWRRDGVISLGRDSQITDEFLPDQRSHLYGITVAPLHCL